MDTKAIWQKFQIEKREKMKLIQSFFIIFLSSCATNLTNSQIQKLDYEKAFSFVIGSTSKSEIIEKIGSPIRKREKENFSTYIYEDVATGAQRLSLNFSSDQKLSGILWIPFSDEKEIKLKNAMANFKEAHFEIENVSEDNPHNLSQVTSYIDKKKGIVLRYNTALNSVEAIAMYDLYQREPAKTEIKQDIKFTFGDEAKD